MLARQRGVADPDLGLYGTGRSQSPAPGRGRRLLDLRCGTRSLPRRRTRARRREGLVRVTSRPRRDGVVGAEPGLVELDEIVRVMAVSDAGGPSRAVRSGAVHTPAARTHRRPIRGRIADGQRRQHLLPLQSISCGANPGSSRCRTPFRRGRGCLHHDRWTKVYSVPEPAQSPRQSNRWRGDLLGGPRSGALIEQRRDSAATPGRSAGSCAPPARTISSG